MPPRQGVASRCGKWKRIFSNPSNSSNVLGWGRLELDANGRQGAQKTLVLLTDGVANLPGSASEARGFALDQAQYAANSNYAIAAISLGANVDTDLMQQIADTTGGVHFHVPGGQTVADYEADLTDVFRQIARERPLRLVR